MVVVVVTGETSHPLPTQPVNARLWKDLEWARHGEPLSSHCPYDYEDLSFLIHFWTDVRACELMCACVCACACVVWEKWIAFLSSRVAVDESVHAGENSGRVLPTGECMLRIAFSRKVAPPTSLSPTLSALGPSAILVPTSNFFSRLSRFRLLPQPATQLSCQTEGEHEGDDTVEATSCWGAG